MAQPRGSAYLRRQYKTFRWVTVSLSAAFGVSLFVTGIILSTRDTNIALWHGSSTGVELDSFESYCCLSVVLVRPVTSLAVSQPDDMRPDRNQSKPTYRTSVPEIFASRRNFYLDDLSQYCVRDCFYYNSIALPHFGTSAGQSADSMYMYVFPAWIFYLASLLFSVPMLIATAAAIRRRRRHGWKRHCRTCGYDLTGNTTGVCSECGIPLPPDMQPPTPVT